MKVYRQFLKILFGVIGAGCLGIMALVIIVDPFFQYHEPLGGFPYIIEDQLSQNPGLARNTKYNAVSLGSSLTVNFNREWFRELFSVDVVKLPYNGAYPRDIVNAMEQVDRSDNQLEMVFLAVDISAYSSDVEEIKYPLPEYLYNDCVLDDVYYWFNKDVLLDYILKPLVDPSQGTDMSDYYSSWQLFEYSKEKALQNYGRAEHSDQEYDLDYMMSGIIGNMDVNICPIVEKHPDTKFIVLFPPVSILFWDNYERLNLIDVILHNEAYVIERLLQYDNVEIYYFQDDFETITDLDNYMDMIHYSRSVSYDVLCWIASGKGKLTEENYQMVLKEMQAFLHEYDYDGIWEE